MSFREFKAEVKDVVFKALEKSGCPPIAFEPAEPPRPEFGDLSVSVAFQAARALNAPPAEAAKIIAGHIDLSATSLISECEAHPQGYINFTVAFPQLAHRALSDALSQPDYGSIDLGGGRRVAVEHTSVNPNKALHVGHLRNLVIGDCVARILRFTGHDVYVLNYVDDSGLQVADIIVGFMYAGFPLEPPTSQKYDHYCGDTVYVKVTELYKERPELRDAQKKVLRDLENPDSEAARFAKKLTRRILRDQLETCWRMGARYDCLNFESHILEAKLWDAVFAELKHKGAAVLAKSGKYAGCWIVRVKGEEEGEEKVLLRSDGTATYVAKDIPYAAWKLGLMPDPFDYKPFAEQPDKSTLWASTYGGDSVSRPRFAGADTAVTVIDVRQSRLQRIIAHILLQLVGPSVKERYTHLGYAVVNLSRDTAKELGFKVERGMSVQMSGRLGLYVNADDVLDALHERSYEATKTRNPDGDKGWLHHVAESVAVAAMRYDLAKQDLDKPITFDIKDALRLEGDTGPYLQYSYARASRILEKSGTTLGFTMSDASNLTHPNEVSLVKEISKFDLYVEEASRGLAPQVIARYAYRLATLFNLFYETSPVLTAEKGLMRARLSLVKAFHNTFRATLNLIGVTALDRI